MLINSRQDLADYALRALGSPVINIEIADEQVSDAVESAIQFYQEYHFDGIDRDYLKHQVTADDLVNHWIPVDEDIFGIIRILPWQPSMSDGLFDLTYQLRMNDLRNIAGGSMGYFNASMEYLSLLDFMLRKEKQFRFNRRMNRLYLDINWQSDVRVGEYMVVECYRTVDADTFPEVMNDIWLKKYVVALMKRYWGSNLRKYQGIALPGGIVLDGERIHAEAVAEIEKLEVALIQNQGPLFFSMG